MTPGTWMTSCPEAMGRGFWNLKKKQWVEIWAWMKQVDFGARWGQTSSLRRGDAHGGVRWKNQHRKKLCLSLLMSKNLKLKKVNKSFVPKPESRQYFVFFGFLCVWTFYEHCERFLYRSEHRYISCICRLWLYNICT